MEYRKYESLSENYKDINNLNNHLPAWFSIIAEHYMNRKKYLSKIEQ
ncbi:MAG: hypothetical protein ABII64_02355 [Elusimicrobiota bacterium]